MVNYSRAIGYGMPYADFIALSLIPDPDEGWHLRDCLHTCLAGSENLRSGFGENRKNLSGWRGLSELFIAVGETQIDHIMIFPTLSEKQEWFRCNDAIDGAFRKSNRDFKITYFDIPFPQYDYYMDGNGIEVVSPGGDPALVPGIPHVLRWWLLRYKVFDRLGVAKLRPVLADWV